MVMKKIVVPAIVSGIVLVLVGAFVFAQSVVPPASPVHYTRTDFALFDGAKSEGAKCGSDRPFLVFITATNNKPASAALTVKFADGDLLPLNIPAGDTISVNQAAGNTQTPSGIVADSSIQVVEAGGISGWMSLQTLGDATPPFSGSFCVTT